MFTKSWDEYDVGFGDLQTASCFWLGNYKIRKITKQNDVYLDIVLGHNNDNKMTVREYDTSYLFTKCQHYKRRAISYFCCILNS